MSDLNDMRHRLRDGQVVVIAGAGVSMASVDPPDGGENVASWLGLLRNGVAEARDVDDAWRSLRRTQIETGKVSELVTAAELITEEMGGRKHGMYAAWLEDTVGSLTPAKPDLIRALHGLGVPIATTNYDDLIEQVTDMGYITWRDGLQWQSVLRGKRRGKAVLHIHGHYLDPQSVILGMRSYDEIRANEAAQEMLKALALTSTFLLVGVGAGLDDPNFGALREWLGRNARTSTFPHYRLVHEGELSVEEAKRDRDDRIHPLPYGPDHSALEPWLRDLAPRRAGAGRGAGQRVLELAISREKVVARASPRGVTVEEPLGLDRHRVSMVQMLEEWLRRRDDPDSGGESAGEQDEAQLLGRILYDSIIHGQVKTLYDEERAAVKGRDRLALVLKLEKESIASLDADPAVTLTALPWELLHGEHEGWLARLGSMKLFRALPGSQSPANRAHERLRILVARAQPEDVLKAARSRWPEAKAEAYDRALKKIMGQFDSLKEADEVDGVQVLERPTLGEINAALNHDTPPNIVHYIGYDSWNTASRKRCVALHTEGSDRAMWPESKEFANPFSAAPPKLVFLHLCEGPRDGYTESGYDFGRASFTDLARLLLDGGVQLVVAMQYPMNPDIGAEFTQNFYDSVRAGQTVGQAVQAARSRASLFYRVGAPILYMQGADESLVDGNGTPEQPDPGRAGVRSVSNRSEDVPTAADRRPDVQAEPSGRSAVAIRPPTGGTPTPLMVVLTDVKLGAAMTAAKAGVQGTAQDTFVAEAAQLWLELNADPGGSVERSQLAADARERARVNPAGALALLWSQLADQIEPPDAERSVGY